MDFRVRNKYATNTQAVFDILLDKEYTVQKYEAMGGRNTEFIEFGEKNGKFVIKSRREVPSNPPGFAKKIIKAWNTVVETDIWELTDNEVKNGTYEIDVKGTPIKISGTIVLQPTDDGCERVIDTNIKCSIPLIGGKIEQFVEADCRKNIDADHDFSVQYLEKIA